MAKKLTRRELLQWSALGSLGLALGPYQRLLPGGLGPAPRPRRVLVLGAGLAGLAAALELVEAGHEVQVLEGRLRPGGRVRTLRGAFAEGLYAEAGAARIPVQHELTLQYAERFGLGLEPFLPQLPSLTVLKGKALRVPGTPPSEYPLELTEAEREVGLGSLGGHYFGGPLGEIGDATTPGWPPPGLERFDDVTVAELLRQQGASEDVVAFFGTGSDLMWRYSALELLMHIQLSPGPFRQISGGTDQLPVAMAERLGERIRYGTRVVRIEQDAAEARVMARVGSERRTFRAERLIVTFPFSVLREIEVQPAFSAAKERAVRGLRYEPAVRVFLQSGSRFWQDDGVAGFARTDQPIEIWDATHGQAGSRGILMAYLRGGLGERIEQLPSDERVALGLSLVAEVFPAIRDQLQGGSVKVWREDPWAHGAYAYSAPGDLYAYHHHTATPEGRIHFAGEHTSVWPGWMQGALHSGLRAAREVAELVG